MTEIGKMIINMDREWRYGQMGLNIKAIMMRGISTGKELFIGGVMMYTKDNLRIIR